MGMELNFSKLDENQSHNDLEINSLVFQLLTAFDKLPVDFSFGFALCCFGLAFSRFCGGTCWLLAVFGWAHPSFCL